MSELSSQSIASSEKEDVLIIGKASAPVTIIEFADYKCPTCNTFFKQIEPEIRETSVDKGLAKIELRMCPHIGLDARPAALGAYCANNQGMFQSYHDNAMNYIYENLFSENKGLSDDVYTSENLREIAKSSGLNTAKFEECVSKEKTADLVSRDLKLTEELQITGTPTFIIGDQRIIGAQPFEVFRVLIEQQLGRN